MDQNVISKAYLCNAIINSRHYRLCCNLIVSTYVNFTSQAEVSQNVVARFMMICQNERNPLAKHLLLFNTI